MTLTPLFGAFCTNARPLEQQGLSVRVSPFGTRLRKAPAGLGFCGWIDAEGLASRASFEGLVSRGPGVIRVEITFASDAGAPHALVLSLSFARPTVRSLTELSGDLLCRGVPFGRAHVRIDWRRLLGL